MAYINGKKVFFSPKVIYQPANFFQISCNEAYLGYKNYQISANAIDATRSFNLWIGASDGFQSVNETPTSGVINYTNSISGAVLVLNFNKYYDGTSLTNRPGYISVHSSHLAGENIGTDYYITMR